MNNRAVFFDRDGVLIKDHHLITKFEQVEILPGAADLIAHCRKRGFKTLLVTNQTVVARGLISLEQAQALNQLILDAIKQQNQAASFDQVYLCPHHPDAQVTSYKILCNCRKPKPGMLLQAQSEHQLDLHRSYLIGDRISDMVAGNRAGVSTILLRSGKHVDPMIISDEEVQLRETKPHWSIDHLSEALAIIAQKSGTGGKHGP